MDYASLEQDDLPVRFFRTSCDLGYAVDPHQGSLVRILRDQTLFELLLRKSADWMDRHVGDLADLDYDQHVAFVRDRIELDMRQKTGPSRDVYQSILAAMRTRTAAELATLLQDMATATHTLVGQAMGKFGGTLSAGRWARCPIAELRFVHGDRGSTRCTFDRTSSGPPPADVITVRIGNHIDAHIDTNPDKSKGALRVYFNLRFYFFHEDPSHAFSIWDAEEFVEGYLVWAAKRMMDAHMRDLARIGFRDDTFQGPIFGQLHRIKDLAEWFDQTTDGQFLTFLLEWAADEATPNETAELEMLTELLARGLGDTQMVDLIRLEFDRRDSRSIRHGLRALARKASGVPVFQGRLRRTE